MRKVVRKGLNVAIIYILLIAFIITLSNKVERLDNENKGTNNVAINLVK